MQRWRRAAADDGYHVHGERLGNHLGAMVKGHPEVAGFAAASVS
jgi:hypothetical protein